MNARLAASAAARARPSQRVRELWRQQDACGARRREANLASARSLAGATALRRGLARRGLVKRFGDPQLDKLMDEALGGSPTLRAADARVRKAGGGGCHHRSRARAADQPATAMPPGSASPSTA